MIVTKEDIKGFRLELPVHVLQYYANWGKSNKRSRKAQLENFLTEHAEKQIKKNEQSNN